MTPEDVVARYSRWCRITGRSGLTHETFRAWVYLVTLTGDEVFNCVWSEGGPRKFWERHLKIPDTSAKEVRR